jgi:uncharacterized membrane protein
MPDDQPLPTHVSENIEAIAALRAAEERALPHEQRAVESVTRLIAQPRMLYGLMLALLAWAAYNSGVLGVRPIDPPPFFILQGFIGAYAAVLSTMILITQSRQSKEARRNAHLDLQVNILAEQRTAKIVALLEELRRDLPNVRDRVDPLADALQEAIAPHAVSSALDETLSRTPVPNEASPKAS